jgi:iron complex transport system permease protein
MKYEIFSQIRLPRTILAFMSGGILAISGLIFQTLFRNALMTPYTLGISSGAVLGAGIAIKLGLSTVFLGIGATTIFGFSGSLLTLFFLIYLSKFLHSEQNISLLLLGIALSLFYTSALTIIFYISSFVETTTLLRFTMGSLSIIGWQNPLLISVLGIFLLLYLYFYRFELQLISISDESAQLKGVDTKKLTISLLLVSSVVVGVLVSVSGPIGFVGLVIPHVVAKFKRESIHKRIFSTFITGGIFLIFCDTLARSINSTSEIPIGVVTAIIGAPFFIWLIINRAKR